MVKRRDVAAAAAGISVSALGAGLISGVLGDDSDEIRDLDSSQEQFDSAEEYIGSANTKMENALDQIDGAFASALNDSPHLSSGDRSLQPGDELGDEDQYVISDRVQSEETAVNDTHQLTSRQEVTGITDLGAELPQNIQDSIDSLSDLLDDGSPKSFGETSTATRNLAIKDGQIPDKGEVEAIAGDYRDAASRVERAYQEAVGNLDSARIQNRAEELSNPEEEAYQSDMEAAKDTFQALTNYKERLVSDLNATAQFFETITDAEGDNLNVEWGSQPEYNWEDEVGVSREQFAEDQGYDSSDDLSLREDSDGDFSVLYNGNDTGIDLTGR